MICMFYCVLLASDPLHFQLNPTDMHNMSEQECKTNLHNIINAIVLYYDQTRGWELESNIEVDDAFV